MAILKIIGALLLGYWILFFVMWSIGNLLLVMLALLKLPTHQKKAAYGVGIYFVSLCITTGLACGAIYLASILRDSVPLWAFIATALFPGYMLLAMPGGMIKDGIKTFAEGD